MPALFINMPQHYLDAEAADRPELQHFPATHDDIKRIVITLLHTPVKKTSK